jgi:hypothetical protein
MFKNKKSPSYLLFKKLFADLPQTELLAYARRALPLASDPQFQHMASCMAQCIEELAGFEITIWRESRGILEPGGCVNHHAHPEWTALLYVTTCDHPIVVEGAPLAVAPGDVLVLRPGVEHWVDDYPGPDTRLVFALLAEKGE